MNPTRLLGIMRSPDAEVVQACAQVYNDWAAALPLQPQAAHWVSVIPMSVAWLSRNWSGPCRRGLMNPHDQLPGAGRCPPAGTRSMTASGLRPAKRSAPVTLHLLTGRVLSPWGAATNASGAPGKSGAMDCPVQ